MTPKEKAEELLDEMFNQIFPSYGADKIAKECALIAVNEVVDQWIVVDTYIGDGQGLINPNLKYWLEVKQELEKL